MLIDNEKTGEALAESVDVRFEKTSDGQNMIIYVGDYSVGLTEKELNIITTLCNTKLKAAHNHCS